MATFTFYFFPRNAEQQSVAVQCMGELPEYGQVWVWDMLYAQQLQILGEHPLAADVKEALELWAVNMSSKVFQPHEHIRSKGHLQLHDALQLVPFQSATERLAQAQIVHMEVTGAQGEMPAIQVQPQAVPEDLRYWLVLAMAQYFIDQNELFGRELPIHILAFRKYHADINLPHTPAAAEEAPLFAIQKAMEYFQSAQGVR